MSDDYQYIDVNDEQWEGTPRELRQALDKAQDKLREATKQVATFEAERASNALSGVLTGFKNPDRVKAAILGDKVDPLDNEAVTKWLEANADDYARADGTQTPETQQQAQQTANPAASAANLAQVQAVNALAGVGSPSLADKSAVLATMPQDLDGPAAAQWLLENGF